MSAKKLPFLAMAAFGLAVGAAAGYSLHSLPLSTGVSIKPFPSHLHGKVVEWIPDGKLRGIAKAVPLDNIEWIDLYGGYCTGVPSQMRVRNHEQIAAVMHGLATALRLKEDPWPAPPPNRGSTSPFIWPDQLKIKLRSGSKAIKTLQGDYLTILFYADIYEGTNRDMEGGTVSPEFQRALRQLSIPSTRPPDTIRTKIDTLAWSIRWQINTLGKE